MVVARYKADLSKLNPQQLDCYNRGICVVCLRNKGRVADNLFCDMCNILTLAEKTRASYGAPKDRNANQYMKQQAIKATLALVHKGHTHKQIAAAMGITARALTLRLSRWRQQGHKFPLMYGARGTPIPIDPQPSGGTRVNPHGGGKWGVRNCPCDPCVSKRRESKREWDRLHRAEVKQYREEKKRKKAEEGL